MLTPESLHNGEKLHNRIGIWHFEQQKGAPEISMLVSCAKQQVAVV